ncbi:hypothetical protein H0H93_000174 [Arthromyces matolae]|nr:hypothetical protein H0H93_000174 [Arthromyces matolae]
MAAFRGLSASLPVIEDSPKRIRVLFGGKFLVDSKKAKLVWEKPYYPAYFFPAEEIPKEFLMLRRKDAGVEVFDVVVGERQAPSALSLYSSEAEKLDGLFTITFGAMDSWFEEDEEVFVHCKDPYKRVDVLQSSRHVRVEVDGIEVANTQKPRLLYETGLRGEAEYYHVQVSSTAINRHDIVWWYRNPTLECAAIRGYVAFYDEKVDVWVDGEKQQR